MLRMCCSQDTESFSLTQDQFLMLALPQLAEKRNGIGRDQSATPLDYFAAEILCRYSKYGMLHHKYYSLHNRKSLSRQGNLTEATATDWLQDLIFFGVGPKHLGWQFPEYEVFSDGSEKEIVRAGPRVWETPPKEEHYKWNLLRDHLKGCFRGLVWADSTHLPFVSVDLDRHDGTVLARPHIREVLATARLLTSSFTSACGYRLHWCIEVNPNNGSVKFFGWSDRPILIDAARKIGEQIHEAMRRIGTLGPKNGREVFPFNHPQVLLPMRTDKITVIDTGVLGKCVRKRKITKDYADRMVPYETYSVLGFCQWLRRGTHFCNHTLEQTLRKACANLLDTAEETKQTTKHEETANQPATAGRTKHSWRHRGKGADNPNSFERQHEALLECCRRARRVVSEQEALNYIEKNRLYTGDWKHNLGHRRARVRWILKHIAKTFDPAKCRGVEHGAQGGAQAPERPSINEVRIGKYHQWAKNHVGTIEGRDRQDVNEYGEVVVSRSRISVDWQFVSVFLSVVDFCLNSSPNEDGSLPHVRAEEIWSRCYDNGQTTVRFSDKKWTICRDWLERQGIIKIVDRNWSRGKAMRWAVLEQFHHLPGWWRRRKEPSLFEAVSLEEFLGKMRLTGPKVLKSCSHTWGDNRENDGDFKDVFVRPPPQ